MDDAMSQNPSPLVSIIIVNYNEEQFLLPLLESLEQYEPALSKEVIILDNFSITPVASLLQNRFQYVTVIPQLSNEGFGRTSNAGIRMAKGKYVLLLNPDMQLQSDCISRCIRYFESHPDEMIGAVAVRLLGADQQFQRSFFHLAASMLKTLQSNPVYFKLFGNRINKRMRALDEQMHETVSHAPWLCGAFMLMNRETTVKQNFFFDEDFFLYSEDCELGFRMNRKNYCQVYLPDAAILHFGGGSMPYLRRFEQLTISEWLCMMKAHGKFCFFINQLLLLCNLLTGFVLHIRDRLFQRSTFAGKREEILRRKLWQLWRRYTFIILLRFRRAPSASHIMLTYSPVK